MQLSAATFKTVVSAIEQGHYLESASALAGLDPSTVRRWVVRGTREAERRARGILPTAQEDVFVRFAAHVRRADARAEAGALRQLRRAGRSDWRAAAWFLEHRHPVRWGPRLNERHVAQEFEAFLDRLQQDLDAATYERVLAVVSDPPDAPDGT